MNTTWCLKRGKRLHRVETSKLTNAIKVINPLDNNNKKLITKQYPKSWGD